MKAIKNFGWAVTQRAMVAMCVTVVCFTTGCKEDDDEPRPQVQVCPLDIDPHLKSVAVASNSFSTRFFDVVCRKYDENILVSPYSMQIAMSLAVNGASGETRDEMMKALGYDGISLEEMNLYNEMMTGNLSRLDPQTTVSLANSIWAIPGLSFNKEYVEACAKSYDAEADVADFSDGSGQKKVSRWAENKTHGMIKDAGKGIGNSTAVALVNATYFAGKWTTQFDKSKTSKQVFYNADGTEKTISMMYAEHVPVLIKKAEFYTIVSMPYGNGTFRMDLLLPNKEMTLDNIAMDEHTWSMAGQDVYKDDVDICLPRFEMEVTHEYNDILQEMGIKTAFTGDADFSAMTQTDLFISNVLQNSKIKVDEEGTKAAAVTTVVMEITSVGSYPLVFNRPFAFMIRETSTQTVLFAGKIMNM